MERMTTLAKVADRVDQLSKNCVDQNIPVSDISFENLETVRIGEQTHTMKTIAQRSISNRLGIPYQYLSKCPAEIQAVNLNHWIVHERNTELFFRFDGNDVRAIFTPKYTPVDNFEVLERLDSLGFDPDTQVQCDLDTEFMSLSVPDGKQAFEIDGDKFKPGISISNSEVGLASLTIAAFVLRLVCTNGLVRKTEIGASYRHVSSKILYEMPETINQVSYELGKQKGQFRLSLESPVDDAMKTMESFNRQFALGKEERAAVDWAWPFEMGNTMFHIVNTYTRSAQFEGLAAESAYKLQKVGGNVLGMLN